MSTSTIFSHHHHVPKITVTTNQDYDVSDDNVTTVIATGACDATDPENPSITVTLPCQPSTGRTLKLVAAFATINVETPDDSTIAGGNSVVPQGTIAEYVFAKHDDDCDDCCCHDCKKCDPCHCEEGVWTPTCCAQQPAPTPG